MVLRLSLTEFVEEELLRVPLVFDAVVDAVYDQWRQTLAVHGRDSGVLTRMLHMQRAAFSRQALASVRTAVLESAREIVALKPLPAAAARPKASAARELKLVDEADVLADLACGRCTERIVSDAEFELRELHAYTSALVGDRKVSRPTNPLQPQHFARALWTACQGLPVDPAVRDDFFRRATPVLAQALRSGLSAACARLEAEGVSPAVHGTVVLEPPSSALAYRAEVPLAWRSAALPQDLSALRTRMRPFADHSTSPDRLDDATTTAPASFGPSTRPDDLRHSPAGDTEAGAVHGAAPVAAPVFPADDPQLAAMMSRLYAHMTQDAGLSPEVSELLGGLKSTFERVSLADGEMVNGFDHPVWRFFDRVAFALETAPPAERPRMLGLARNLIDNLANDALADASRFAWAIDKLDAQERQSLRLATKVAAADILRLVQSEQPGGPQHASTRPAGEDLARIAIDIESLDTVPGSVMPGPASGSEDPPLALNMVCPGERMRIFLQGQWRPLQLLWSRDDLWLLRDLDDDRKWVLRPGAIERLIAERLAQPLRIRSLARLAAEQLQDEL